MAKGGKAAAHAAEGIIAKGVKDLLRVAARDVEKDAAKDAGKALEKDLGKTLAKDLEKDLGKDVEKGLEKDLGKDAGKDLEKDATKGLDDRTLCADPVDVVTGEVVAQDVDVELSGVLPLVLARTHSSSYRRGRLFGPTWSSTLDQRLEVDAAGVVFVADEAMVLHYPRPGLGEHVLPERGPHWPLTLTADGTYTLTQPEHGRTLHFTRLGEGIDRPLCTVTDRNGNRIDLDRDDQGTPTLVRHSGGYQVAVDSQDGLVTGLRLLDPATPGGIPLARFGYGPDARLTEVTNSSGLPMTYDYDPDGRLVGWQDRNGTWYRYVYDDRGRCVRANGRDGHLDATFTYDDERRVRVVTDSLGHATTYHLDQRGRVVREVDPLGHATLSEWDDHDRLVARTDPLGHTTRHAYDPAGNLVEVVRPDGTRTRAEYDQHGNPVLLTQPDGATWRQEFDQRGNLVAVTDPAGATTHYAHDERGRLTSITDALGRRQVVATDAAGLVTAVTDPDGAVTRYERDGFGRITAATDPLGNTTRLGWTVEGKVAWRVLPDGATDRWTYDAEGNQVSHTDPLGQVTTTEFGAFDLPTAVVLPDGRRSAFAYDTELRLVAVTNPAGQTWSYTYDAAGLLVSETDVNGRTLTYTYDPAGRLVARTGAGGQTTLLRRDANGEVVERRHAPAIPDSPGGVDGVDGVDGAGARGAGDAAARAGTGAAPDGTAAAATDGGVTTFVRDAVGRVVRATGPAVDLARTYDPVGRLLSETTNGRTVTFGYDRLGRRTSRRTPSGVDSVWEYGPGHDLPVALHTAGQSVRFGYDAAGREVARRVGPDLLFTQSWDANSRLHSLTLTAGGLADAPAPRPAQLLHRRAYTYRSDGHPTAVDDHRTGLHTFTLDTAGRITAVTAPGWSERYAYDALDNVVAADWPAQSAAGTDPTAGERSYAGTLVRGAGRTRYEHDRDGRLAVRTERTLSGAVRTWRYTWNADDQLTDVHTPDGQHWRYRYDPFGRRVAKERLGDDGTVVDRTVFCWDGTQLAEQTRTVAPHTGRLPELRPSGPSGPSGLFGPVGGHTTTWEYRPGTFQPISQTDSRDRPAAGTPGGSQLDQAEVDRRFYAIVTDLVGAPTELVGPDGALAWQQRRTVWGGGYGSSGVTTCPLRFPGQYFDPESGLHYNVMRLYDPDTAGYTSSDPLGQAAGPNPHGYAPNPMVWFDPLGLAKKCKQRVVYRQLNAEDRARFDAGEGLLPKGTSGDIAAHVRGDPTRHISASQLREQTERFASGNGLVEIDVDAAINGGARYVDHNNVMQAVGRAKDASHLKQLAERAGEVLFIDQIPFNAMKLVG